MRNPIFLHRGQQGGDFLTAIQHSRLKKFRLICDRLLYGRRIPWRNSQREMERGRDITWTLRTRPAPEGVVEQWPGNATIIAVRSNGVQMLAALRSLVINTLPLDGI